MHPVRRRSRRTAIPLAFIFIIFFFLPLHRGKGAFGLFSRRRSWCSLCSRRNTPVSLARSPSVSPKRIIGRSCSYNCRVKRDRQAFEAKKKTPLEQLWRLSAYYPEIGQLLGDHRQGDRGIHARNGRAHREMNAIPKRYISVRYTRT